MYASNDTGLTHTPHRKKQKTPFLFSTDKRPEVPTYFYDRTEPDARRRENTKGTLNRVDEQTKKIPKRLG